MWPGAAAELTNAKGAWGNTARGGRKLVRWWWRRLSCYLVIQSPPQGASGDEEVRQSKEAM